MAFKRILVAVDFSDASEAALRVADQMAIEADATLTLLHVVPLAGVAVMDLTFVPPTEELQRWSTRADEQLVRWSKDLRTPSARVRVDIVSGDPVLEIEAASRKHDLLVLGTHGRRGLSRLLLGSVAERTARGAHCSVLLVRGAKVSDQGESP